MLGRKLIHSRLIRTQLSLCLICFPIASVFVVPATGQKRTDNQKTPTRKAVDSKPLVNQTITQGGVSVTFSIQPITATGPVKGQLIEATEATVRFEITDTTSRKPLTNLRPVAWIDARGESAPLEARGCREKVQTLLQSNFAEKADVDLNSYFILTLNHEPNISVIDPFSSVGPTRLYTLVALRSPGEDWVLTANQKRLFVSLPQVNQVAVVDTSTWQVIANIDAGIKPSRLALSADRQYLWVGNDSAEALGSGVTVIDTTTLKVSARITTGAGHHEIGFTENDRYAFVTNKEEGTLSIFNVHKLAKLKDLPIGLKPTALTFSSLSKTVYVANEGDGNIVAVDGTSHAILTRITMQPGLHAMRLTPDDRYGFVTNIANDTVSIFDVSTNRFLQRVPVGPGPDQLAFTRDFAYVRSSK